jgi:hypothetical protein
MPSPGDEQVLSAQISGIITFADLNILTGSNVAVGSKMFIIKSNEVVQSNLGAEVQEAEK